MKMKLHVLAGAKQGTVIPLKKDEFVIGRAPVCTLRAGSDAISRRHCAILCRSGGFFVRDLGSRNGTYVNDQRIEGEVQLTHGDELRVGPLKFRVEAVDQQVATGSDAPADAPAAESKNHDLKRDKAPPVKDFAEMAQRLASSGGGGDYEDDISRWLLGQDPGENAMRETQTLRIEDTKALRAAPQQAEEETTPEQEADAETSNDQSDADDKTEDSSSRWSIFGRGKGKEGGKQKPGKLPKVPKKDGAKDSREAAADVLREMTRRR